MWCGLGGRQLRWPVRQVVLFNTSMSWSNHRVRWCFSHLNKVVSRCPFISYMQRNVSPSCTVTASFWCFLAWKNQVHLMLWVKSTNACVNSYTVYAPYGLSALADWNCSTERILAVLRLEWKGFCGHRALRSVIWLTTLFQSLCCWSISRV